MLHKEFEQNLEIKEIFVYIMTYIWSQQLLIFIIGTINNSLLKFWLILLLIMILFFELFLKIYYKLSNITYIFRKVIKFQESWSICLQDYLRFSMLCVISKVSNEVMFCLRGSPILEEARRTVKKIDGNNSGIWVMKILPLLSRYLSQNNNILHILMFFSEIQWYHEKAKKKFSHYSIYMMVFQ